MDVAIIDEYTILFQAVDYAAIGAVAGSSENELVVLHMVEGIFLAMSGCSQGSSFLSFGLTKQLALDNLSDVLLVLDEVCGDCIVMETEEE